MEKKTFQELINEIKDMEQEIEKLKIQMEEIIKSVEKVIKAEIASEKLKENKWMNRRS